jgi:hypothetical protein
MAEIPKGAADVEVAFELTAPCCEPCVIRSKTISSSSFDAKAWTNFDLGAGNTAALAPLNTGMSSSSSSESRMRLCLGTVATGIAAAPRLPTLATPVIGAFLDPFL